MTPARLFVACIFLALLLLLRVLAASAGPADPRLLNGVLEWPSVVANEPFVIVRGDDGVLYDVGVTAARREGAVTAVPACRCSASKAHRIRDHRGRHW
jgi:hypothetical protein